MPIGSALMRAERGFTYLWLLFVLAVAGAGLAAIGQVWSTASRRDRERELLFRGEEFAHALWAFQAASGVGPSRPPRELSELVEDRRSPSATRPLRHLRRVYDDPFTGQPDWVIERDEKGGIKALHSRSMQPALLPVTAAPPDEEPGHGAESSSAQAPAASAPEQPRIADHRFEARPPAPPRAASAPSAPASASSDSPSNSPFAASPFASPASPRAGGRSAGSGNGGPAPYTFPSLFGTPSGTRP